MLKINILAIGKIKEKYILDGIEEYSKRLSKYIKLNIVQLQEEVDNNTSIDIESDRILNFLEKNKSFNILLDINGNKMTSEKLAKKISDLTIQNSTISFIIGGSKGVNKKVKKVCDYKLSFSDFTFPHQLFRLILLEQLYRAICIINNIKYHK